MPGSARLVTEALEAPHNSGIRRLPATSAPSMPRSTRRTSSRAPDSSTVAGPLRWTICAPTTSARSASAVSAPSRTRAAHGPMRVTSPGARSALRSSPVCTRPARGTHCSRRCVRASLARRTCACAHTRPRSRCTLIHRTEESAASQLRHPAARAGACARSVSCWPPGPSRTRGCSSSRTTDQEPSGNGSDWVGRGFMEHPRDRALRLRPRSADLFERSAFYDQWRAADGTWIIGRLGLSHAALTSEDLLNASATLLPRPGEGRARLRAALPSFAASWMRGEGHGWSRRRGRARVYDGFTVLLNVAQTPHPENRVTLSTRRDSLGVPRPALHWRWRADDHARLDRVRACFGKELEAMGAVTIDRRCPPRSERAPSRGNHPYARRSALWGDG